ncbi:uncharacterized protein APUU_11882S [Aspergillus puulaauensis]|uniref:Ecp2 effector protein domain-containing protein n=1 Tax=Aspergillus puulaauensis TaxID=1220207 RepID=A0A7R7XCZ7_9EURO|nr:uncharacterized protein APUU_11882S [Aspergillus puulaauensis]BCS19054.1 hypothetical protein APUU_11882S [Aspergillus puulaauensis]
MFRPIFTVFVALLALMQVTMAAPTTSSDITSLEVTDQDLDLSLVAKSEAQRRSLSPEHVKVARSDANAPLPSHEVTCRTDDRSPQRRYVEEGIRALRAKEGPLVIGEGTSTFEVCDIPVEGRVRNSAIWVCNYTGRDTLTLASYSIIADAAQLLVDQCKREGIFPGIEGEVRFSDGWTVSIHESIF